MSGSRKIGRWLVVAAVVAAGSFSGVARADVTDSSGTNIQDGDASADAVQGGASGSGDAVGGQVSGIVSSGDTSVDAKNRTEDADVTSGEASASNTGSAVVGQNGNVDDVIVTADITNSAGDVNRQDGDDDLDLVQTANASSGDGVAGQVVGAVTSAGGSTAIVADNASEDVDAETGNAFADNFHAAFVGQTSCDGEPDLVITSDIVDSSSCNVQDGNDSISATQTVDSSSGDGVAGEVIGAVSAGDTRVDAKNRSTDVDVASGVADASNEASQFAGEFGCGNSQEGNDGVLTSDVVRSDGCEVQDGDNDLTSDQGAAATSGDGVGGQVIGAVTSAGGSADIVADNASEDVDIATGEADATNEESGWVGLDGCDNNDLVLSSDLVDSGSCDGQDGDNSIDAMQDVTATSGDGVGGQVIGTVSAGDTSVDAKNRSTDTDIDTGLADASNEASQFAGLRSCGGAGDGVLSSDLIDSDACNAQDGDNEVTSDQSAGATTGDGVGGQVIGSVTSAGGSADIVADNASDDVDLVTGEADASNEASQFAGSDSCGGQDLVLTSDLVDTDACNGQDGDNATDAVQNATASSGDAVGGEVVGAVSAGDTRVDAKNRSTDVDVDTGLADASNQTSQFAGLESCGSNDLVVSADLITGGDNYCEGQDGDNDVTGEQTASAATGDGVGGQVVGSVTSAGGSADIVADNASEDVDVATGEADASNEASLTAGLVGCSGPDQTVTADIIDANGSCDLQDGDNSVDATQAATASSGDGVGGQVVGSVSAGDTRVDAKNRSTDVDIDTGLADAENHAAGSAGLFSCGILTDLSLAADVENSSACNVQDGDNDLSADQTADATTGDGVGGQVIGAVTSAGGSADIVADNASEDVDIGTGEATADNHLAAFVGLATGETLAVTRAQDVIDSPADNVQDGDNSLDASQAATASSGDGVGGMVLGVVSAGDASIDAKNRSTDVDLDSGEATATNDGSAYVGLSTQLDDAIVSADVDNSDGTNVQDGDNDGSLDQTADAGSGDAVGGLVGGAVVTAGGSADAVLDNVSEDVDAATSEGDFTNADQVFIGLSFVANELVVG